MFTKLIDALKATRRTIVFTEGPDALFGCGLDLVDIADEDDVHQIVLDEDRKSVV